MIFKNLFKSKTAEVSWVQIERFEPVWRERVERLAELIAMEVRSVVDYGCGEQYLRNLLPAKVNYIPVDYTEREPKCLVIDLNGPINLPQSDAAFCSGVLEYIVDLPRLIKCFNGSHEYIYCSYNTTESVSDLNKRKSLGWKNHLKDTEFIGIFLCHGFDLIERKNGTQTNTLYVFRNNKFYEKSN